MAADNALGQSLLKRFHWILGVQRPKRRRDRKRTGVKLSDGMTSNAIGLNEDQSPLR